MKDEARLARKGKLVIIEMMTYAVLSDEEMRAAYRAGEEAVVVMLEQQIALMVELAQRIQMLEDQLAKNSRNKGKSPSGGESQKPVRKRGLRQ
ncbi:MAG: hypothetical protein K1X65_08700 [Caldilineales bacterium]|nr:hypothetical protein [Caldilineales bacterium]MCW5859123.1 hypothetical protein [Caldilineales bacterium]